jgi:hypothetical protein
MGAIRKSGESHGSLTWDGPLKQLIPAIVNTDGTLRERFSSYISR